METHHQPGHEGASTSHTIHFIQSGEGSASHYSALVEVETTIESVEPVSKAATFSTELIDPYQVALPRKANVKTKKQRKLYMLTDTQEKEMLEAEQKMRTQKKQARPEAVKTNKKLRGREELTE